MNILLGATPPPRAALPFGWFDAVVVVLLIVGFFRGRKNGMSQEILLLLQWLLIIVVGSHYYEALGKLVYDFGVFNMFWSNLLVYAGFAVIVKITFTNVKRFVGEKIFASDVFGRWEFYLGMIAGILRYACWVLFAMALISSRTFTMEEIKAKDKQQEKDFGSTFFPSVPKVQQQILNESFTGTMAKTHVPQMLLKPYPWDDSAKPADKKPAKKKESVLDEVIGNKPAKK